MRQKIYFIKFYTVIEAMTISIAFNCVFIVFHVSLVKASLSACYSAVVISEASANIRDFLEYDKCNAFVSLTCETDITVHESV